MKRCKILEEETKQTLKNKLPNYEINKVVICHGKRKDGILNFYSRVTNSLPVSVGEEFYHFKINDEYESVSPIKDLDYFIKDYVHFVNNKLVYEEYRKYESVVFNHVLYNLRLPSGSLLCDVFYSSNLDHYRYRIDFVDEYRFDYFSKEEIIDKLNEHYEEHFRNYERRRELEDTLTNDTYNTFPGEENDRPN